MIKHAVLTLMLLLFLAGNLFADVIVDSVNYKIEIDDFSGSPGNYVRMPVKLKNAMALGGLFIRLEYDSSVIKPVAIADEYGGSIYDSLELVGRGLNTLYEQYNGDTAGSMFAFHPVDDPIDPTTIFIQYLPPFGDEVTYIDVELGEPSIICYLMFEVMTNTPLGQTTEVHLADYSGPEPYYRQIQMSDTLGEYVIYTGGGPTFNIATFTGLPANCGDINYSGTINLLDITALIDYLYNNDLPPEPSYIADVNGDEAINILDVIYLIEFLYSDGPPPACP